MKEYELYLPLTYNDGSPIESAKLVRIRERLLEQFGSLTFIPQERVGFWKSGRVTYQDRIVVYRIVCENVRAARRFFRRIKADLKIELQQKEIFIVERDAKLL